MTEPHTYTPARTKYTPAHMHTLYIKSAQFFVGHRAVLAQACSLSMTFTAREMNIFISGSRRHRRLAHGFIFYSKPSTAKIERASVWFGGNKPHTISRNSDYLRFSPISKGKARFMAHSFFRHHLCRVGRIRRATGAHSRLGFSALRAAAPFGFLWIGVLRDAMCRILLFLWMVTGHPSRQAFDNRSGEAGLEQE